MSTVACGTVHAADTDGQWQIQTLKHYCSMNQKERNALRTIMEVKIKGLVDVISSAVSWHGGGRVLCQQRLQ